MVARITSISSNNSRCSRPGLKEMCTGACSGWTVTRPMTLCAICYTFRRSTISHRVQPWGVKTFCHAILLVCREHCQKYTILCHVPGYFHSNARVCGSTALTKSAVERSLFSNLHTCLRVRGSAFALSNTRCSTCNSIPRQ